MKKTLARGTRMPKPDAFERMLADLSMSDLIGSVYYTGRLLQRRKDLLDVYQGFRVPNIASEPTDQEQEIAFSLLRRIEAEEQTPVHDLDDAQAGKYISRFSRIVQQRIRAREGFDPERGERLLAGLRAQYK
jgi:hypothetical protein